MHDSGDLQARCISAIFYFICWLAFWTLGSNFVSMLGLDSAFLPWVLLISLGLALALYLIKRPKWHSLKTRISESGRFPVIKINELCGISGLLIGGILLSTSTFKYHSSLAFFLIFAVLLACSSLLFSRRSKVFQNADLKAPWRDEVGLCFILLLLLFFYFLGHQPDYDDTNFINLGLGAYRSEAGVFVLDTMLGDGPTAIHLPSYRVHSFELLFATLGHLLPGEAIFYAHFVLPFIFIIIFALTLFLVYRPMLSGFWVIGAIFHLAVMIATIDSYRSFGAHGLFRFFQGKIFFIQVLIPLLCYATIYTYKRPKSEAWLLLSALAVCSVGMTANAIYAAPLCIGLVLLACIISSPKNAENYKKVAICLSACAYPILIGVILVLSGGAYPSQFERPPSQGLSLFSYFGYNYYGLFFVCILPAAFYVIARVTNSLTPIYYSLGLVLFIFNPIFWPVYSYVTGNLNFRIYWATPFAIIFSLSICYVLITILRVMKLSQRVTVVILVGLSLNALALLTLDKTVYRERLIKVNWKYPDYRVDQKYYSIARKVHEIARQPCRVLVPSDIAHHLTMIEGHPYPIAISSMYQTHYRHTMDIEQRDMRTYLLKSVSVKDTATINIEDLRRLVAKFDIGLVLIDNSNVNLDIFRAALQQKGFKQSELDEYRLYYRECNAKHNLKSNLYQP